MFVYPPPIFFIFLLSLFMWNLDSIIFTNSQKPMFTTRNQSFQKPFVKIQGLKIVNANSSNKNVLCLMVKLSGYSNWNLKKICTLSSQTRMWSKKKEKRGKTEGEIGGKGRVRAIKYCAPLFFVLLKVLCLSRRCNAIGGLSVANYLTLQWL